MDSTIIFPRKKRYLIWFLPFVCSIVVFAGFTVYGIGKWSMSERAIAVYCKGISAGELLIRVRQRAGDLGLITTRDRGVGQGSHSDTVISGRSLLSGASFCSLQHDGNHVTAARYNPWYH